MIQRINRFNYWLMSGLADLNASAWTFYALVFVVVKVLQYETPHGYLAWTSYLVQTLYQGAALPLCAFVAKAEGRETRKMIQEVHDWMRQTKDMEREELDILKRETSCPFIRGK